MSDVGDGPLEKVTLLLPGEDSGEIYDEWAGSYDQDLTERFGYMAPALAVEAFVERCPDRHARIIDFGCGTGLVGEELARRGYEAVDGLDISEGMLQQARAKNVYAECRWGDLTTTLDIADSQYDAALCVGSFGNGHIEPRHVPEMVRTVRPGGLMVLYMNGTPYGEDDYASQFAAFEHAGVWMIAATERSNYMAKLCRPGFLVVATRC